MKRCVFFSLMMASLLLAGCKKYEELEFSGKVLWVRECSGSYLDAGIGYVVQLDYPEGVGADITDDAGKPMRNLIVLYEPTCRVYVDDKLHGTFYVDNTYSRANCSLHYDDYELPEGVFTKTVVD